MTKRKPKTAAEFLAERNADPEYVARRGAQEDARVLRETQLTVLTEPLRHELGTLGYPLSSLDDLLPRYAPLPAPVVELLLKRVASISDTWVQEQIVRALGASAVPFSAEPLITLFRTADSSGLRYAIANTMAHADVRGAGPWLLEALADPGSGVAREMLALAVARHCQSDQANPLLVSLLDELPGHVGLALSESGGVHELNALEAKYAAATGWRKKAIGRAISVIRRRVAEQRS